MCRQFIFLFERVVHVDVVSFIHTHLSTPLSVVYVREIPYEIHY